MSTVLWQPRGAQILGNSAAYAGYPGLGLPGPHFRAMS